MELNNVVEERLSIMEPADGTKYRGTTGSGKGAPWEVIIGHDA
jgi:hypothetical protein